MDMTGAETFNNRKFLVEKPLIVAYEDKTESLVFAQSSDDEHVEKIYYYFFKGFINLGVYVLKKRKCWCCFRYTSQRVWFTCKSQR